MDAHGLFSNPCRDCNQSYWSPAAMLRMPCMRKKLMSQPLLCIGEGGACRIPAVLCSRRTGFPGSKSWVTCLALLDSSGQASTTSSYSTSYSSEACFMVKQSMELPNLTRRRKDIQRLQNWFSMYKYGRPSLDTSQSLSRVSLLFRILLFKFNE